MTNPDGSTYIGEVWPGYTVFPDWLGSSAGSWWSNEMVTWHNKVAFDGAWIDMSVSKLGRPTPPECSLLTRVPCRKSLRSVSVAVALGI